MVLTLAASQPSTVFAKMVMSNETIKVDTLFIVTIGKGNSFDSCVDFKYD